MSQNEVHECQCEKCQSGEPEALKQEHHLMNLFMSRLDEQERRWYAALEAKKIGHGGLERIARITGLHVNTIRRGQEELATDLSERPTERVRIKGGGRKRVEKKSRR